MARGATHYHTLTARDLSRRQREVLELVAAGRTNSEIAERLGIPLDGAKWHVSEILGKLGVASREEAADWWRGQRTVGSRLASFARAFAPLGTWKFAAPVLGAVAVAGAIALGIFLFRDAEDAATPARCTVDDVILEPVEAFGPNGPGWGVFIALTARSRGDEESCTFDGEATVFWKVPDVAAGTTFAATPVETTIDRERTALAYVTLSNWCSAQLPLAISAGLTHKGEASPFVAAGPQFVVERPQCDASPGVAAFAWNIVPAALSSFIPDLGPDPLDFVFCYPSDPAAMAKWLRACQATELLHSPGIVAGSVANILRVVETREYACPEPGRPGLGGEWPLCDGAREGEVRSGIPFAMHGSSGGVFSVEQLGERFLAMLETAKVGQLYMARVATVACLDEACATFALGVAIDGSPSAAYFIFEPRGDASVITATGFAGDIALVLRRGGEVASIRQEDGTPAKWIPIVPPY